jgi:hypothetical protein
MEFSYKATVYYGAGVEHDTARREALERAVTNAGGSDLQIAPEDADLAVSFRLPADSVDAAKFTGDTAMTVVFVRGFASGATGILDGPQGRWSGQGWPRSTTPRRTKSPSSSASIPVEFVRLRKRPTGSCPERG